MKTRGSGSYNLTHARWETSHRMITVKATSEGLLGKTTASGYVVDKAVPFVALPSALALSKLILVLNPLNGAKCYAFVLDVGPWNTTDDAYVFGGQRPLAESQPNTNGSGIVLGFRVWTLLGMTDNTDVTWSFVEVEP